MTWTELRPQFKIRVTMVGEFKNQTAKRKKPCYNWQLSNTVHQQLNITELNQELDVFFWVGPQLFETQTLVSHSVTTENKQKNLILRKVTKNNCFSISKHNWTYDAKFGRIYKHIGGELHKRWMQKPENCLTKPCSVKSYQKWKYQSSKLTLTFEL